MRIIFAGRDNPFNRRIVEEFSAEHEVVCCLFLEPGRVSRKGKLKMIMRRVKKQGIIKTVDQLAFHVFDRWFLRKKESSLWQARSEYCNRDIKVNCPTYEVENINQEKWVELCRSLKPDIILATCSQVIFKKQLYRIPPLGTYVVHEGLTPEYKGLHTPLWALMNKEFQHIGYTVLKADSKIDGGEVLVQDTYSLQPGESYNTWSWIGHNAIISGMENIKKAFKKLEKEGHFVPVNVQDRKSGYYTWMSLSGFIGLYFKNYWKAPATNKSYHYRPMENVLINNTAEEAVME